METILKLLSANEKKTLASVRKLDEHPLLQLTYYGDYHFDDFLKQGAQNDKELEAFLNKRLFKTYPINLDFKLGGCTVFVARNELDEILFCRNFDFVYTPVLQLFTSPSQGYKSVSTTALKFYGYTENFLFTGINKDNIHLLGSPYIPCDGMNEKGLAIGFLYIPEIDYKKDDTKITLNSTTMIRVILDKASTVKEAIELIKQYNVYFSADILCHYLLADASGDSALVEYWNGGVQVLTTHDNYQIATNYIACKPLNYEEDWFEIERARTVENSILESGGHLTNQQAIDLSVNVGGYIDGTDILQWTVIYNLTRKTGKIFARRNIDNIINFQES